MKNLVITLFLLVAVSVRAQSVAGSAGIGAILGAGAGAVIGNNSRSHDSSKGAIIGAVAGGLIGTAVGQHRVIKNQNNGISDWRSERRDDFFRSEQIERNPHAWEPRGAGAGRWVEERRVVVVHAPAPVSLDRQIADAELHLAAANRNVERHARDYDMARAEAERANVRVQELMQARNHLANASAAYGR